MPELPEIEHLRRTLAPVLIGARVLSVRLRRRDIVRVAGSRIARRGVRMRDLLEGAVIRDIARRGKSLAVIADAESATAAGRVLALHMGMTGRLLITPQSAPRVRGDARRHVHCEWVLRAADGRPLRMIFRDPRRFGGLWPFDSMDDLLARPGGWSRLGPDALTIETRTLRERLSRTSQPIKAALLNQTHVAGVGNIYADEALFASRIHPMRRPDDLAPGEWRRMAAAVRGVLQRAIDAGGSTIRDYVDASGAEGLFAVEHRVYGRGGLPCVGCRRPLNVRTIGQRTTVYCTRCQPS